MARILLTSGPTRQYFDPVRYLSNGSSGKMGAAIADAAIELGHDVVVVSGPVAVDYPDAATVIPVVTTQEMLDAAASVFPDVDGLIAVAAPCDYQAAKFSDQKIKRTGGRLSIELEETEDILATLSHRKTAGQWTVGFALETNDAVENAINKIKRKQCDLIVLNGTQAMGATSNSIRIINAAGEILISADGAKSIVAQQILKLVDQQLIRERRH